MALQEKEKKARKKKKKKKNSIEVGVNEHNQKKVVDSVLKNHKPFFINISTYRDRFKFVNFLPIFGQ